MGTLFPTQSPSTSDDSDIDIESTVPITTFTTIYDDDDEASNSTSNTENGSVVSDSKTEIWIYRYPIVIVIFTVMCCALFFICIMVGFFRQKQTLKSMKSFNDNGEGTTRKYTEQSLAKHMKYTEPNMDTIVSGVTDRDDADGFDMVIEPEMTPNHNEQNTASTVMTVSSHRSSTLQSVRNIDDHIRIVVDIGDLIGGEENGQTVINGEHQRSATPSPSEGSELYRIDSHQIEDDPTPNGTATGTPDVSPE